MAKTNNIEFPPDIDAILRPYWQELTTTRPELLFPDGPDFTFEDFKDEIRINLIKD